jgi:hypothetical protein
MRLAILGVLLTTTAAAEPLHVTAKVVEMPKQLIACGKLAYRAVVRYEVISVDQGSVSGKELFVVELCPEFRKRGEQRTLKLRPVNRNDSFVDDFKATTGQRWVAR